MAKKVLVLEGRLHFYEGYSWEAVCRPMHVLHSLGIKLFIATNAAGGIHPSLGPGSLMAIRDHVDWTRPRCGLVDTPEKPSAYSTRLIDLLQQAAATRGIALRSGRYAAVLGPNYETPAEIRALAKCGADAVGMSTAREIETACELGLECAGVSCITNRAAGIANGAVITHEEVLETAAATCEKLARLIEAFIELVA
jgi:purine-nucleoside phosphorylase